MYDTKIAALRAIELIMIKTGLNKLQASELLYELLGIINREGEGSFAK